MSFLSISLILYLPVCPCKEMHDRNQVDQGLFQRSGFPWPLVEAKAPPNSPCFSMFRLVGDTNPPGYPHGSPFEDLWTHMNPLVELTWTNHDIPWPSRGYRWARPKRWRWVTWSCWSVCPSPWPSCWPMRCIRKRPGCPSSVPWADVAPCHMPLQPGIPCHPMAWHPMASPPTSPINSNRLIS